MRACSRCGELLEGSFRYCPWCAAPQRVKLVEFFRAHAAVPGGAGKALRVSRYLDPDERDRHVRFSVWNDSPERAQAEAAVSLDDSEAWRLARFLQDSAPPPPPRRGVRAVLEQLGLYVREPR
jgi:hypothetical protein